MIELKNITKRFGAETILNGISCSISPGELVCITGPSGAGKSTLIHLLSGAQDYDEGSILVDSVELKTLPPPILQMFRRRVGVVFQDYKLLSHRTVRENIAFPLEVCGVPDADIHARVDELLAQMGLQHIADKFPKMTSGGEQARTALARAIVHKPLILLADEPTGNIDPIQTMHLLELLRGINTLGTTVIIATHDTRIVDSLQSRVIRIEGGNIVRDSAGGYLQESAVPHPYRSTGEHQMFSGLEKRVQTVPQDDPPADTPPPSEPSSGQSVKITSIG